MLQWSCECVLVTRRCSQAATCLPSRLYFQRNRQAFCPVCPVHWRPQPWLPSLTPTNAWCLCAPSLSFFYPPLHPIHYFFNGNQTPAFFGSRSFFGEFGVCWVMWGFLRLGEQDKALFLLSHSLSEVNWKSWRTPVTWLGWSAQTKRLQLWRHISDSQEHDENWMVLPRTQFWLYLHEGISAGLGTWSKSFIQWEWMGKHFSALKKMSRDIRVELLQFIILNCFCIGPH